MVKGNDMRQAQFLSLSLPVLAVVAVLALLANWYAVTGDIEVSPIIVEAPADASAPASAAQINAASTPSADYSATLARPLFRASRRPPATPDAAPETTASTGQEIAADLPGGTHLAGVIKEVGKPGRALLRTPEQPSGDWVEIGHEVGGWRLAEIEAQSVAFEASGQRRVLSLFTAKSE